jgi:hypothetical protein
MTTATPTILRACWDPRLFKPWFKDDATWAAWFAFLKALFALPLSEADLATYRECTGRTEPPATPSTEAWLICGRRAGKSFMLALVAVYLATFHEYRRYLAPGERGVVMVIARDRRQTRIILGYIRALLMQVPMLRQMVDRELADSFELTNGVGIECQTASYRAVRGYTCVAALCDELAFWPHDDGAADPDYAVLDARVRRWRRSPALCCCVQAHRMRSVARFMMPSSAISARMEILCWCGRPPRGQ